MKRQLRATCPRFALTLAVLALSAFTAGSAWGTTLLDNLIVNPGDAVQEYYALPNSLWPNNFTSTGLAQVLSFSKSIELQDVQVHLNSNQIGAGVQVTLKVFGATLDPSGNPVALQDGRPALSANAIIPPDGPTLFAFVGSARGGPSSIIPPGNYLFAFDSGGGTNPFAVGFFPQPPYPTIGGGNGNIITNRGGFSLNMGVDPTHGAYTLYGVQTGFLDNQSASAVAPANFNMRITGRIVPEPSGAALLVAAGALGALVFRRRR